MPTILLQSILSIGNTQALEKVTKLPDLLSRIKRMEFMTLRAVQNDELRQALDFVSDKLEIKIEL